MTTYHRWFILPMQEYENADGGNVVSTYRSPKYVSQEDRLDGFTSGGPFSRTQVSDAGYDHLLAYNDAEEWRVVVAWGEGNEAWNALNEIHAYYHDTETLADHDQDVKPVMDDRFGPGEWSVDAPALDGGENTA
jgi:hypothetical protein